MQAFQIKLINLKEVENFINLTKKLEGDVTVKSGQHIVDGKNKLGVLSLDLKEAVTVYVEKDINLDIFGDVIVKENEG